ncbi:heptaprenyl diphosphate synthase component II [Bacillus sp. FJAT-44742]|uniref:heptaprenyl diphosphate synthase component II n=1 Tax=Bacillus sp. FJAT-44742 TaxID=2014005 RepID=UPI000C2413F8|nr:heptaprenyl diphosphate synthase component II [Bacillus sp. FJAT-44742]
MKLADLYNYLRPEIQKIEEELERSVLTTHPVLEDASLHLLKAGGKRIRPVVVLLAGNYGTYDIERIKHIAVSLELIHMASLVHDDVIDDAELRRGQKTIKAQWDNRVAMYSGDYLFAKAIEKATFFEKPEIHKVISNTMIEMCIGEVEQIRDQYNWDQNLRTYLRRIRRKTAILIAVSCELGAMASDASKADQRRLHAYGYNLGMSYQIIDDVLDFVGTEKELGKPAGSDLLQGNITLPVLYAMDKDSSMREKLREIFANEDPEEGLMREVLQEIRESGGMEFSKDMSQRYLKKAFEALEGLPDISATESLQSIAKYIGKRDH